LLAENQTYSNYLRIFNDSWEKDGDPFGTTNQINVDYDNEAIYTAEFLRGFSLTLSTAQYIESGSGGSYKHNGTNVGASWSGSMTEGDGTSLEAVPPTSDWFLLKWSNGSQSNPFTPSDNVSQYAVYKGKLLTSSSFGTSSNNQRKIAESGFGNFVIVYESANRIWLTRSTNGGST